MSECSVNQPKGYDFAMGLQDVPPRSPLSTGNPPFSVLSPECDFIDLILDGTIDTSIEQLFLYRNVCEMQSSNHSPSGHSFISDGEESRIDSELQFLAGIGMRKEDNANKQNTENRVDDKEKVRFSKPGLRIKCFREGYMGPYLLKQARDMVLSGNLNCNARKPLELAIRAMKSFEASGGGEPSLSLVMCLHVVAALHCRVGEYDESIRVLERSIEIPVVELGLDHAVAKFAGCMQLGDTYSNLGRIGKSIQIYEAGLEIQRRALGEKDMRYGNTCRYLAGAYIEALQFDDVNAPGVAMDGNAPGADMAAVDCSIGDAYLSLGKYDEAVVSYQKALKTVRFSRRGDDRSLLALVFICLARLCCKKRNFVQSRLYCDNAVEIYNKGLSGMRVDEVANGFLDVSGVYVLMGEFDRAIQMLEKVIDVYGNRAGSISMVGGIEAQMGTLYYIMGRYDESYDCLKSAVARFRTTGETKTALYGIALNQMGVTCLRLVLVSEAKDLFAEARTVLEGECRSYHTGMIGVYGNLAGTYDAMGR